MLDKIDTRGMSRVPQLHEQWRSLDFRNMLSLPTAYLAIGYSNSILADFGAQAGEGLWQRTRSPGGALEATAKLVAACRARGNRMVWTKYEIFRQSFPQTMVDKAQYDYWAAGKEGWTESMRERDCKPVAEISAMMQPDDMTIHYTSLGNVFLGTMLPSYLNAWGVRTILLSGFHLDWCIEQAARSCRDMGYMPIVVGDACGCGRQEDDLPTLERINTFFAPVLSSADVLKHLP